MLIRGVKFWKRISGFLCEQTPAPMVLEHRRTGAVGVAVGGHGVWCLCQRAVSQSLIGRRSCTATA